MYIYIYMYIHIYIYIYTKYSIVHRHLASCTLDQMFALCCASSNRKNSKKHVGETCRCLLLSTQKTKLIKKIIGRNMQPRDSRPTFFFMGTKMQAETCRDVWSRVSRPVIFFSSDRQMCGQESLGFAQLYMYIRNIYIFIKVMLWMYVLYVYFRYPKCIYMKECHVQSSLHRCINML